jgi:2-polyprenyl-6-methoxyphenol hydroxylase-like FAD-dependent oxidoreductase
MNTLNRIDGVRFVTPRTNSYISFSGIPTHYAFVGILPQWKTEALLLDHLRELGGDVRYGHMVRELSADDAGVTATIDSPNGSYRLRAKYLAGCDGVYSTVRQAVGIEFDGASYEEGAVLADAAVETPVPRNEARVHVNRRGVVTLFPIDAQMRRIVVIMPREPLPDNVDKEWLQERVTSLGYADTSVGEPSWTSAFRVHHRVARRMRMGPVFLAGDSAHTQSPVGGQGMNVGLADAWNLSEKLVRVQTGNAPEGLLDAYERERLPIARRVVRRTNWLTRVLADPSALARFGRETVAPILIKMRPVHERIWRDLSQIETTA